jgi:hypothetical protein
VTPSGRETLNCGSYFGKTTLETVREIGKVAFAGYTIHYFGENGAEGNARMQFDSSS